ncbi:MULTISPECIES: TRAP transporter substrate-binding protein [Sulfurovum]|uniref:TRAP transporter substrate-binding protein n=1 Tax=Sulfurovum xiamenensis TaxID=3019066 RepID=A0ABT7QU71_9BACT|nr:MULTISPECIES: TRAP transporter substrate-binding protein [Sulfurovum]EIF51441.1 C4-dicarboxylate transporter substrate-binding protein [Sulfurovum sp. AR]MDM5264627.1 TRAP transporter substrate-binding protein [Sulfurovum xiamenensis]
MRRRDFITGTAIGATALALNGCHRAEEKTEGSSVNINRGKKVTLKLATSWPAHFPIMGTGVDSFAKRCAELSGGTLEIKVYAKNILVPALQVFDSTSAAQIDAFHSGVYYWKGKNPAFSIFGGMPLGLTSEEMVTWMKFGGGYELWRELYGKFNLYPLIGGTTGPQMGGWFKKEINSLADLKGLKMRIPGLGGEVMKKLGVNPVLLPAGEIYTSLERGTIDATEWVGPALDSMMGFAKAAPYYYTGWHEPGSILEITFNKARWEKLSSEHQAIITAASEEMSANMLHEFRYQNAKALQNLPDNVEVRTFPKDMMDAAKVALGEVLDAQSAQNEDFKRVLKSYRDFVKLNQPWDDISTKNFLNIRG